MKPIDLTGVLKGHTKGYVAVSKDYSKVITTASTLSQIAKKLEKSGDSESIVIAATKDYGNTIS